MSLVTPVSNVPARNVNTGAVTLSSPKGRLEVVLDAAGATEAILLVQGEGGDWFEEGTRVKVDSQSDLDGGKSIVYFSVKQPGSRYHVWVPNAPASYRVYLSAAADAATALAALSASTGDIEPVGAAEAAGSTGRAADAGHVHVLGSDALLVAVPIGTTTPAAGAFTTLGATGVATLAGGAKLAGASPAAAADQVQQGVADVNGATTAGHVRTFEGGGTLTERVASAAGAIKQLLFAEDVEDDDTVTLPAPGSGKLGQLVISSDIEGGMFNIASDGTVTKIAGSSNAVATDTDTKLCVFNDAGTPKMKNRLGSTKRLVATYTYES